MRRLAVATDHAGALLKDELVPLVAALAPGWEARDLTQPTTPDDDYPDAARLVAEAIATGEAERGLLLCGSGIGVAIAAGKFAGIGAACVHDVASAAEGVICEGLTVLCLGGRVLTVVEAAPILAAFLAAEPAERTA
jgi:ribose 5-phosphate isomerase B